MTPIRSSQKHVVIDSDLERIDDLLAWMETCWSDVIPASKAQCPLLKAQALTAIAELFTNAVRHAHRDLDPPPPIKLTWTSNKNSFSISINDYGSPFAPEQMFEHLRLITARGGANPCEREHHWGLLMLLRLCDNHDWILTSKRSSTGINTVLLEHAWPSLPTHAETLRLQSARRMQPTPASPQT